MKYIYSVLVSIFMLSMALPSEASSFKITQEVSPSKVRVGEEVNLVISLSVSVSSRGGAAVTNFAKNFNPPDLSDFSVIDTRQSTRRQIGITNGSYFQEFSHVYTYVLKPKKEGLITIKPASMIVKKHKYYSNSVSLTVLPPKTQPQPSLPGKEPPAKFAGDEFVHVTVSDFSPYQGQPVVVSWYLYTFSRLVEKPRSDLPDAPGFFSKQLFSKNHTYEMKRVRVGRSPYFKTLVFRRVYWPQKSGDLTIGRRTITYFTRSGMFSYNSKNEFQVASSVTLHVKPLPATGKPAGFNEDNVGRFRIKTDLSASTIKLNEAIDLTITITGEGLFTALKFNALPSLGWARIEKNGLPDINEKIIKELKITGSWTGKYILIPTKTGKHVFPPVKFTYFNPKTGRYETTKSKKVKLRILDNPGAHIPANTVNNKLNTSSKQENLLIPSIKPLHLKPTVSSSFRAEFHESFIFKLIVYIPFLIWLGLGIFFFVKKRSNIDKDALRKKKAKQLRRKALSEAKEYIKSGDTDKFYASLSKAVISALSDVTGQSVQGLTNAEVSSLLFEKTDNKEFVNKVTEFVETLDFARYAPSGKDKSGEMTDMLKQTKALISELENM